MRSTSRRRRSAPTRRSSSGPGGWRCEIAIHRLDGELAHGDPTPIPDDIALDGIDEMLHVMLAGDWWAERVQTEHPVDALVAVEAGGRRWVC